MGGCLTTAPTGATLFHVAGVTPDTLLRFALSAGRARSGRRSQGTIPRYTEHGRSMQPRCERILDGESNETHGAPHASSAGPGDGDSGPRGVAANRPTTPSKAYATGDHSSLTRIAAARVHSLCGSMPASRPHLRHSAGALAQRSACSAARFFITSSPLDEERSVSEAVPCVPGCPALSRRPAPIVNTRRDIHSDISCSRCC